MCQQDVMDQIIIIGRFCFYRNFCIYSCYELSEINEIRSVICHVPSIVKPSVLAEKTEETFYFLFRMRMRTKINNFAFTPALTTKRF